MLNLWDKHRHGLHTFILNSPFKKQKQNKPPKMTKAIILKNILIKYIIVIMNAVVNLTFAENKTGTVLFREYTILQYIHIIM